METIVKTPTGNSFITVDPSEFKEIISAPDIYLLDVRDKDSYNEGHIGGAHNLDVLQPTFKEDALKSLPKDKKIAVYCRSGKRSAMASEILADEGFKIINLVNGITGWQEAGYPVTK